MDSQQAAQMLILCQSIVDAVLLLSGVGVAGIFAMTWKG